MNNGKSRSGIMGVAGGYLIYLAYQLYQGWNDPDTTMSHPVMVLFMALFVLAGGALIVFACRLWKQANDEEAEKPRTEDENALK